MRWCCREWVLQLQLYRCFCCSSQSSCVFGCWWAFIYGTKLHFFLCFDCRLNIFTTLYHSTFKFKSFSYKSRAIYSGIFCRQNKMSPFLFLSGLSPWELFTTEWLYRSQELKPNFTASDITAARDTNRMKAKRRKARSSTGRSRRNSWWIVWLCAGVYNKTNTLTTRWCYFWFIAAHNTHERFSGKTAQVDLWWKILCEKREIPSLKRKVNNK